MGNKMFLLFALLTFSIFSCKEVKRNKPFVQPIQEAKDKGLKDWADFPIGGAISVQDVLKDRKLDSLTAHNFNSLTATNDMKMYSIVRNDSIPKFHKVDSLVTYCKSNNMRLFGHALVWHYALPKWISETTAKKGAGWADNFLKKYIDTIVTRYKDDVVAWDVVNEAFDTKTGAYRKTFWQKTMGEGYIEKAFRYAHKADPNAKLFYNDFGHEKYPEKLDSIINMITDFKQRGVPIHGIGLQMHLEMSTSEEGMANALKKAAATGLLVHISELDIIFRKHNDKNGNGKEKIPKLTETMKKAQAEKFKQVALLYRKHVPKGQRFGITFWDFTDRDTWLRGSGDHREWPTVFDEGLEPKPAYFGFAEGLATELKN